MDSTGVAVLCYWNGRVGKSWNDEDVVYKGHNVNAMPVKLNHGISYSGLLDKIYAITGIDRHKFALNIICRYPISPKKYKAVPISNDEAVQVMLEVPSRSSTVYCVELFLEKQALERRKWEDLEVNCLVNVFQKVGLESLIIDVPYVCKSWYKASLNPNCWKILNFGKELIDDGVVLERYHERFCSNVQIKIAALMKFVVDRSHGCATTLELPICHSEEILEYAANKCPSLKSLAFYPSEGLFPRPGTINSRLISKFKNLEMLTIEMVGNVKDILRQISIHCKNLVKLSAPHLYFLKDEAAAIASLPKIRYLVLRKANFVKRENLLVIIDGCRDLIHLDVSNCIGFDDDDTEILELTSHIPEFICQYSSSVDHRGRSAYAYLNNDDSDY